MITLSLKIAGLIIGTWAGFKLAGIGIAWAKRGFKKLKPPEDD